MPSYRNQSIHLLCKSIDWFLYDRTFGVYCVKQVCKQSPWKRAILRASTSSYHVKIEFRNESWKSTISKKCVSEGIQGVTIFLCPWIFDWRTKPAAELFKTVLTWYLVYFAIKGKCKMSKYANRDFHKS